jgi:hypothetical protein
MNEERVAITMIVAALVWLLAVIAAFWLVGPVAGILVIVAGLGLFGLWLARVIRSPSEP